MICLHDVKWVPTKGHNRFVTAIRMFLGLRYDLPLDTKLAEELAAFMNKGDYHNPPERNE